MQSLWRLAAALAISVVCAPSYAQPNNSGLLRNPGFEEGLAEWEVTCDPNMGEVVVAADAGRRRGDARSGKQALCIRKKIASVKDEYTGIMVSQKVQVQPGTVYVVRVFAKHTLEQNVVGHAVRVFVEDPQHRDDRASAAVGGAGKWRRGTVQYTTAADTRELRISLALTYSSGTAFFDDVLVAPADSIAIDWEIPALKPLHLKTPLVEGGQPKAVIVCPKRPAYQAMARKIADRVREATGASLPVRADTETSEADWRAANTIALGNLMTNKLVERLYCLWYVRTDAWYPGKGGHEVRTVHDPWGAGTNVILLGGSDDEGVAAAVEDFLPRIGSGKDVVVDKLMAIKFSPDLSGEAFAKPLDAATRERHRSRIKKANMRSLMASGGAYAFNYYASGDDGWAELHKESVLEHRSRGELGFDTHMDLWYTLIGFDLAEESAALTDQDRKELTKYLLYLCRSEEGANKAWMLGAIKRDTVRHNHIMLVGLDALFGGEYFRKYYRLEETNDWIENAATVFKGQERHSKTQCDANGYEGFAVSLAMVYALAKPDPAFFESGAARKATERLIRCLNNMVCGPAYGDSWDAFWFPMHLVQMAHWHYRDPRYQYLIQERLSRRKGGRWANNMGLFTDAPAVKPTDLDGVQAIAVDSEFFAYSTKDWKVNVPLERSFDKVVFRERLDPAAQYLMLDGLNIGSHGHMDANTIVEFSDRERIWLVDMSYTDGVEMKDHNGVTVIKDGLSTPVPAGAELVACADFAGTGFSKTALREHSGADWTRSIVWRKGGYFLVFDEVKAREDGDFNLQCLWRTLGKPALDGNTLRVEQVAKGDVEFAPTGEGDRKRAVFRSAEAALEFEVELPAGKCALAVFGKGKDSGSDSVWLDFDGKRIETAFNLPTQEIGPSSAKWDLTEPTPSITVGSAGKHKLLMTLREGPGVIIDRMEFVPSGGAKIVVMAQQGRIPAGAENERRDVFVLKNFGDVEHELVSAGPGFGHYWKSYPYAEPEVNVLRQKAAARLAAGQRLVFVNLFYAKGAESADDYDARRAGDDCAVIGGKEEAVAGVAPDGVSAGSLKVKAEAFHIRRDGFSLMGAASLHLNGTVMSASKPVSVDCDLSAKRLVVQAAEDVEVEWPAFGMPPKSYAKGTHAVELAVSADAGRRYAESVGALLAAIREAAPGPKPTHIARPSGPPLNAAWKISVDGGVNCLAVADTDGDGRNEILFGTGQQGKDGASGRLYRVGADGTERWNLPTEGPVTAIHLCDLDGDGAPGPARSAEIIAGTEAGEVYAVDAGGKLKWKFQCPPVDASIPYTHYGSGKGAVRALWAGALEKGGKPLVMVGAENGYLTCLDASGQPSWRYRTMDTQTSITAIDALGDGNREVLCGSQMSSWSAITAVSAQGKGRRVNGLDGWGSCLTALHVGKATGGDGKDEIVAGTSKSKIYLLNSAGRVQWTFTLGDAPTLAALADLDGDGKQEVLAGSPCGYVYSLSREGKLLWRLNLGEEVTALCTAVSKGGKRSVVAGTKSGRIHLVSGGVTATLEVKGAVTGLAPLQGGRVAFGSAGGEAGVFEIPE